MKAVIRDLNCRTLDAWKVSIKIDPKSRNVWLYLTEPCYAVSAGRWFYTSMHEDGRVSGEEIALKIDGLVAQLTDPAFVRERAARDFRNFQRYREDKRFQEEARGRSERDDSLAERARAIAEKHRGGGRRWGDW